jgi:hypothetical protein
MSGGDNQSWPIPAGLCAAGQTAAGVVAGFLADERIQYHGGGGKFYSPAEWRERGEEYGLGSLLLVTHDGGDHAGAFNSDYEQDELHQRLHDRLSAHGFYAQQCTSWYSAIYQRP